MTNTPYTFAFFGTDEFSVITLDALKEAAMLPALIVTAPDRKQGRGMQLTPPPAKTWAEEHNIPIFQPEQLDEAAIAFLVQFTNKNEWDFFVVTSYGIIVPQEIIDIPTHGVLNVHPSLLPKHRGATPIETVMLLDEKETGITVMLVDKKMDHGPILNQEVVTFDTWQPKPIIRDKLAAIGGTLLAETIPAYIAGTILPQKQNHKEATFTKKIAKHDGEITDTDCERDKYLKYLAYQPWPGVFFFDEDEKRVKITQARFEDRMFIIEKVIPEGKKECRYGT